MTDLNCQAIRTTYTNSGAAPVAPISPLASAADALIAGGYSILPDMAAEKIPAEWVGSIESGHWQPMGRWNNFSKTSAASAMVERWKTWPDANIGIVLGTIHDGKQLICIDVDTDNPAEQDAITEQLPPPNFAKKGNRGFSVFYLAPLSVRTKSYRVPAPTPEKPAATRTALEVLTGNAPRQTVMPPSLHPLGMTYSYLTGDHVVPIERLPVLTEAHFLALDDVMERLGWNRAAASTAADRPAREAGDGETTIWRETNDYALRSLDFWVPDLGLPKTRRRGAGAWEAVPVWRPSSTGREDALRKTSLKFHTRGIKDMGTEVGYPPLDVVQAAFGCTFDDGFAWLRAKLGLGQDADTLLAPAAPLTRDADGTLHDAVTGEVVGDVPTEPLSPRTLSEANSVARNAATGALVTATNDNALAATAPGREPPPRRVVPASPALVIERHGEPSPFPEPFWFIKGLVPTEGTFLLAGVSTAGKTFVALSLATALATGAPFMGLPIRQTCGSIILVGEGRATIRKRLAAAINGIGGAEDGEKLPISFFEGSLKQDARAATVAALKAEKARMKETLGIDLGVVFVDTLAACFEFEDENSSSEATKAMNVLRDIGRELGCLVIATAHHGKNEAGGVRGVVRLHSERRRHPDRHRGEGRSRDGDPAPGAGREDAGRRDWAPVHLRPDPHRDRRRPGWGRHCVGLRPRDG